MKKCISFILALVLAFGAILAPAAIASAAVIKGVDITDEETSDPFAKEEPSGEIGPFEEYENGDYFDNYFNDEYGDSLEAISAFFTAFSSFILAYLLFSAALMIAIAVIVYRDASKNNMEPPVLWALLIILTKWIGVVLYLILRHSKRQQMESSQKNVPPQSNYYQTSYSPQPQAAEQNQQTGHEPPKPFEPNNFI